MKSRKNLSKHWVGLAVFSFLVVTGTYNSVVISSESSLVTSDFKFVKRLDEVYGVITPGRDFASAPKWKKLVATKGQSKRAKTQELMKQYKEGQAAPSLDSSSGGGEQVVAEAAVQEELTLKLTDVINPKKWKAGIKDKKFSGSLSARGGVIEELNVSLPDGEGISIAFSGMAGNVFEYDVDGEPHSAMMYQVDQNSYKVNLTSGPLEGTILTFSGDSSREESAQQEEQTAESAGTEVASVEVDEYGRSMENQEDQAINNDPNLQTAEIQTAFEQDHIATQHALNNANGNGQDLVTENQEQM